MVQWVIEKTLPYIIYFYTIGGGVAILSLTERAKTMIEGISLINKELNEIREKKWTSDTGGTVEPFNKLSIVNYRIEPSGLKGGNR